jgi:FO synthase
VLSSRIDDDEVLHWMAASAGSLPELLAAAGARRDSVYGRSITFSPKVFLPLTNLCRNRCDYCSFRRSPRQPGAWTMAPQEVEQSLSRAQRAGCIEALFCLGDTPEDVYPAHRAFLNSISQASTVDYLLHAGERALAHGLLPHTNAGILSRGQMLQLKAVNASLGLMLESVSARLCEPGMPHAGAPDKHPRVRLRMSMEAGELCIPFTSGILIGIGETPRERVETLLAIRDLQRTHGHIQEVIVQCFRAHPRTLMRRAPELDDECVARVVALARLILPDEVSVQVPPNLVPNSLSLMVRAGVNDLGGISPVTPDFINALHAWPHLATTALTLTGLGYHLRPRLPVYDAFVDRPGFMSARLRQHTIAARQRLARFAHALGLAHEDRKAI